MQTCAWCSEYFQFFSIGKIVKVYCSERCRKCAEKKRYYDRYPEKADVQKKRAQKRYYRRNKDQIIASAMTWQALNPERNRTNALLWRSSLCDSYVRHRLSERSLLKASEIPDGLVAVERERLKIVKFLKETKHGQC